MLVLYLPTLLNLSFISFCVESLGFSVYSSMSFAYNDRFISSLSIWIPLFLALVWLLCLELPILHWREVVRVTTLVSFQILAGRLSTFHLWILCWLWCIIFIDFSDVESTLHSWNNSCLVIVNNFFTEYGSLVCWW